VREPLSGSPFPRQGKRNIGLLGKGAGTGLIDKGSARQVAVPVGSAGVGTGRWQDWQTKKKGRAPMNSYAPF